MTKQDWIDGIAIILFALLVVLLFVKPFAFAARWMFWLENGVWFSGPGLVF